jgi:hypothetical protein
MYMGSVDGWDSSYVHFKNPLLHNGCTFIMHKLYK